VRSPYVRFTQTDASEFVTFALAGMVHGSPRLFSRIRLATDAGMSARDWLVGRLPYETYELRVSRLQIAIKEKPSYVKRSALQIEGHREALTPQHRFSDSKHIGSHYVGPGFSHS